MFEETVYKDIAFGPRNMGLSEDEINTRVHEAAALVGLKDKYLERSPFELSGGQKRRAAIAGVLAMNPRVLILDEPTAGLDPKGRDEILSTIRRLHQERADMTVIFVSHSMEDVANIAEMVVVMNNGHVAMTGSVAEVFSRGAELKGMGLNVPEVTRVTDNLRDMGYAVPEHVYTVEYAAKHLAAMIKEAQG